MTAKLKNLLAQLAIATTGAVLATTVIKVDPSKAAGFSGNFTLESYNYPTGNGSLSFTNSNLTGKGQETATLSSLQGASFSFNYSSVLPLGNGGFPYDVNFSQADLGNPTFLFNNGYLVGIDATGTIPVSSFEGRPGYGPLEFNGTDELALTGAKFAETLSGTDTFYNPYTGEVTGTYVLPPYTFDSGSISFNTFQPITPSTPVPEPTDTLGLLTVGILAASQQGRFKRQRKQVKV